jgi:tRNA pseudouridine38-40 synthase
MNYCLTISYDGTDFNGWQAQGKENLRTVQEVLENAAKIALRQTVKITASGRTDAGVHALGQTCSFVADTTIPPEKIADCLNTLLPPDVKAVKSEQAAEGFDACRSAKRKTYVYSVYFSERENPLLERFAVRLSGKADEELLLQAMQTAEGEHNFKAFCASNSSAKTTVRTVYSVKLLKEQTLFGVVWRFYICGNGFLYNMVRTLVGTFLDIASGRKTLADLENALSTGNRNAVGRTLPAKGLCLYNVEYNVG